MSTKRKRPSIKPNGNNNVCQLTFADKIDGITLNRIGKETTGYDSV